MCLKTCLNFSQFLETLYHTYKLFFFLRFKTNQSIVKMNETHLSLSTSQRLQPFVLVSKSVKGVANTKLIMDALNAPGVYVFTELYESPNVIQVSTGLLLDSVF